jgi:hypothetical protein
MLGLILFSTITITFKNNIPKISADFLIELWCKLYAYEKSSYKKVFENLLVTASISRSCPTRA